MAAYPGVLLVGDAHRSHGHAEGDQGCRYFGEPVYTYSLEEGIDDGFLAPYKVVRIDLDEDLGWRPEKGQTDKHGQEIEDRVYNLRDLDKTLVLEGENPARRGSSCTGEMDRRDLENSLRGGNFAPPRARHIPNCLRRWIFPGREHFHTEISATFRSRWTR